MVSLLLNYLLQTGEVIRRDPLTHRESLIILEELYDLVLEVEQLRRDQPHAEEEPELFQQWQKEYDERVDAMWDGVRVLVPLETRYARFRPCISCA